MGKKKKAPFKIITDAPKFRDRLGELTGNELKVWMYLWLRTNGELTAFPGNDTIASELNIGVDTVKDAKRGLRAKGWTSRESQRRRENGTMSTVVEKTHLPWVEKASTATVVEKTDGGKTHQQKEYSVNPEVPPSPSAPEDSGNPLEVEVSESVSESVSEAAPPPPSCLASPTQTPETLTPPQAAEAKEKTKTEPRSRYADLNPAAMTVVRNLYPGWIPSDLKVDAEELNQVADQQSDSGLDWNEFFVWHRAHKPPKLIFRNAAKFLAGWEYAVNDFIAHDTNTCARCKKLGAAERSDSYAKAAAATAGGGFSDYICNGCDKEKSECVCPVPAGRGFDVEEAE